MRVMIINGPNLNMLGKREPEIYGRERLDDIIEGLRKNFPNVTIDHFQSNHEGELVDKLQSLIGGTIDGVVVNFAALSHYSYSLFDALNMLYIPKIEVHISHVYQREEFRHKSVTVPACNGIIAGLGTYGYHLAVQWLVKHCADR